MIPFLLVLLLLTGCGGNTADGSYQHITQEEAKGNDGRRKLSSLDVREQDEYDSGHIPGAVLLPVGSIDEDTAAEVIRKQTPQFWSTAAVETAVKTASSTLADLGYTNIYEFGGINTWPMIQNRKEKFVGNTKFAPQ